ncbi:MAG: hypothetical protein KJ964_08770 [Verrucomicrobia bacterium]|nr:hypothetical protein [Verrucomicrobiota bacterium]MBU1734699.1 hypothetical protein [Verrucomicrobiota bacterium]MBU1856960.1 hypothetical protein [Verrucomicrobiota bacterium]
MQNKFPHPEGVPHFVVLFLRDVAPLQGAFLFGIFRYPSDARWAMMFDPVGVVF